MRTGRCHRWRRNCWRRAGHRRARRLRGGAARARKQLSDRVRGEFMAPWGVTGLAKLELLQPLREAGALLPGTMFPMTRTSQRQRPNGWTKMHAEGLGEAVLQDTPRHVIFSRNWQPRQALLLGGAVDISVTPGSRPRVSCTHDGAIVEFQPRLVIGASGRNSTVRKDLDFKVNADEPRCLLGGMLVKGVPSWPRDLSGSASRAASTS